MVKSSIRVVLRIRPSAKFAEEAIKIADDKQNVQLTVKGQAGVGVVNHAQENFPFKFDQVLHNASQETVFEVCGQEAVESVLDGYNCTVMAYGQTGAGKTYSMTGGKLSQASFSQRGLIPRSVSAIFNAIAAAPQMTVTVRISYCELYNETFYDLLAPNTNQKTDIAVMEDSRGGVHVKGLSYHIANSEEDTLGLLFEGETNRAIAEHQLNKASSRSHTVFTIHLEIRPQGAGDSRVLHSKLHLVDLAGSERLSKTRSEGTVAKEAQHINKSLSFLEQVILALANKNRDHIPYRSSRLTHLLKDSLGGNCKTLMLANIWGESSQLDETLSTCKFAQRMMRVSNDANVNFSEDTEALVSKYEDEIRELKQELAMHDAFANRRNVHYEAYTTMQRTELREVVKEFLHGSGESIDPLELNSLRHIREILLQCRVLFQAKTGDLPPSRGGVGGPGSLEASFGGMSVGEGVDAEDTGYVGDLEGVPSALDGCMVAPEDARPPTAPNRRRGEESDEDDDEDRRVPAGPPPDKNDAFLTFKAGVGAEVAAVRSENKSMLRQNKRRMRDLALGINATKREIDDLRVKVDEIREQKSVSDGGEAAPVTKEEYASLLRMKELKQKYRSEHDELKMLKSEVEYTTRLCKECTKDLVSQFEAWYASKYGGAAESGGKLDLDADENDEEDDADTEASVSPKHKSNQAAFDNAQKLIKRNANKPNPVGMKKR